MNSFTLQALKIELENDPLQLGYSANTDATLALINQPRPSITKPRLIPCAELLKWAAKTDILLPLKDASETVSAIQGIAYATLLMLQGATDAFDLSDEDNIAMVDALVAGNVMTVPQRQSLADLATAPASRAEGLWGRNVTLIEIEQTRN